MGYLSQRKGRARLNVFLNTALTLLAILIILPFFSGSNSWLSHVLSSYRLQYYALSLLLIVTCIYAKSALHCFMFVLLFIINYFSLASHSNIFFNSELNGVTNIKVAYFNDVDDINSVAALANSYNADIIALNNISPNSISNNITPYQYHQYSSKSSILSRYSIDSSGSIPLSPEYEASYVSYKTGHGFITIVNVDFEGLDFIDKDLVFKNLGDFVLRQYNPVIIIGDFGVSSFSPSFKNFLIRTELGVKNRIIFKNWISILNPPSINVLGYNSSGVEDITSLEQGMDSPAALLFSLQSI